MSVKGGCYCVVRGCNTSTVGTKISMFRIPKDLERSKQWLKACNRLDLEDKSVQQLYNNYRVCALHFNNNMFSDPYKKRLLPIAIPTEIIQYKETSHKPEGKIVILSDVQLAPSTSKGISSPKTDSFSEPGPSGVQCGDTQNHNTDLLDFQCSPLFVDMHSESTESRPASSAMSTPSTTKSETFTQTNMSLSLGTPRKRKLRESVKNLRSENVKVRRLLMNASTTNKTCTLQDFDNYCDRFFPNNLASFIKIQARLCNITSSKRRYTTAYKEFSMQLYFLGPRSYKFLQTLFYLPSTRTLRRFTENLKFVPGLNNIQLYKALEIKVSSMGYLDKDCILCIDEMALKENLFYHIGRDEVVGLVDIGDDKREYISARNANVFMIRGLTNNWKLPLGYFFIKTCKAPTLKEEIEQCIQKLKNIGLRVRCVITDMGSNFMQLHNILKITPETPWILLNGDTIPFIFDTPHLLKATRNNLIKHHFVFNDKKTSWEFISSFYNMDVQQRNRLAPKLTPAHINPTNFQKMKVKLAAQVISHTVASGLEVYLSLKALPSECIGTIEFIEKFNKLFDVLNSKKYSGEDGFLNEMFDIIKNLKVINGKGHDVTKSIKCLKAWAVTIKGIQKLWTILKENNHDFMTTRFINQDCLENFFGQIRSQGGNSVNPTPIQFERSFRKLFCQRYFHTGNENCSNDFATFLIKIKEINMREIAQEPASILETPNIDGNLVSVDPDYRTQELPAQNGFTYVCGYLAKKILAVHSCETCAAMFKEENLGVDKLFTHFKSFSSESIYGNLIVPNNLFLNYIFKLEQVFYDVYPTILHKRGVGSQFLQNLKTIEHHFGCSNFPTKFLLSLFIRLRLFYTLKYHNRNMKKTPVNGPSAKFKIVNNL